MMRKMTVCAYGLEEKHREKIRKAAEGFGFSVSFYNGWREAGEELRSSEVILGCEADALAVSDACRWFCTSNAGVEGHVNSPHLRSDMLLTNSAGAYGVTISEHIVMAALMLLRRQMEYTRIISERRWERGLKVHSICGSRILIMGTGDIGKKTAERLRAFRPASIRGVNRSGRDNLLMDAVYPVERLDDLLPDTDILIMCMPGTGETAGLMNRERLHMLPQGSLVINVGRGSAIDQEAIKECLRSGHLAGAALDVFEKEPIPESDDIWEIPNLLITPHCSGNVSLGYTVDRFVDMFLEDLDRYVQGKPLLHEVDRKAGY